MMVFEARTPWKPVQLELEQAHYFQALGFIRYYILSSGYNWSILRIPGFQALYLLNILQKIQFGLLKCDEPLWSFFKLDQSFGYLLWAQSWARSKSGLTWNTFLMAFTVELSRKPDDGEWFFGFDALASNGCFSIKLYNENSSVTCHC